MNKHKNQLTESSVTDCTGLVGRLMDAWCPGSYETFFSIGITLTVLPLLLRPRPSSSWLVVDVAVVVALLVPPLLVWRFFFGTAPASRFFTTFGATSGSSTATSCRSTSCSSFWVTSGSGSDRLLSSSTCLTTCPLAASAAAAGDSFSAGSVLSVSSVSCLFRSVAPQFGGKMSVRITWQELLHSGGKRKEANQKSVCQTNEKKKTNC